MVKTHPRTARTQSMDEIVILFCDGACSGNPGPGGWGTIIKNHLGKVQELGGFEPQTTNNRMELTAALSGLSHLENQNPPPATKVHLYTDSVYVIRGINEWIHGWRTRGWQTSQGEPVANKELWEELYDQVRSLKLKLQIAVDWKYVPGHKGIPGNERADAIAVAFSKKTPPVLYTGEYQNYSFDLDTRGDGLLPEAKSRVSAKNSDKAYYLSYVNGQLQKHSTWKDCEARVKGRAGAKFKKVSSLAEEEEFLQKWRISL